MRTIPWSSRVVPLFAVISSPVPSPLSGPFEGGIRLRNGCIRGLIGMATHPPGVALSAGGRITRRMAAVPDGRGHREP